MIRIFPGIGVAAFGHHTQSRLIQILKGADCEFLCVLAVVRLILIKVRVQSGTKRTNGNTGYIVEITQIICNQVLVEVAHIRRREHHFVSALILLLGGNIVFFACITVVNGL